MNTAFMIGLDYLLCPDHACISAWKTLHQCFTEAGFSNNERLFTIDLPCEAATRLAEAALCNAEASLRLQGFDLSTILSTCSALEYSTLTPLLQPDAMGTVPGQNAIEVSFLETGAFQAISGMAVAH